MKFVLDHVNSYGVRFGRLLVEKQGRNLTLETPLCLVHTRSGFQTHVTPDIDSRFLHRPAAALLSVATMFDQPDAISMATKGGGVRTFYSLGDQFTYLSVQDPCHPPRQGFNERHCISLWNSGGRSKMTVAEHVSLVEAFKPDAFEALCDSASSLSNKPKRIKKSVDRTLSFLDQTLALRAESQSLQQCMLLGAIQGSDLIEERVRSARETSKRGVDGFVLEGWDLEHDKESMETVIRSVTDQLPREKPRFIHGLRSLEEVLLAVEEGVDVCDTSLPYLASEQGMALVAQWKIVDGAARISAPEGQETIDLQQEKYTSDFRPLLPSCSCLTCSCHSRAYIHHLLDTRELLAKVLLMTHNLQHYFSFFHDLRQLQARGQRAHLRKTTHTLSNS